MLIRLGGFQPELMFALLGRLLLILVANEIVIMLVYRWLGLPDASEWMVDILDGVLLAALSSPPIYFWVIVPILRERRRTDEVLQQLMTLAQDPPEAILLPDNSASIERLGPALSPRSHQVSGEQRC